MHNKNTYKNKYKASEVDKYSFQLIAHAGNCSLSGKVWLEGAPVLPGMVNRLLVDVFFFSFNARSSSFWKNCKTYSYLATARVLAT